MASMSHSQSDASLGSALSLPDISLGSAISPIKPRVPSATSATTAPSSAPISTPSPPSSSVFSRRRLEESSNSNGATPHVKRTSFVSSTKTADRTGDDSDLYGMDSAENDVLDTPAKDDALITPMPSRLSVQRKKSSGLKGGSNLTLRDQEKHIDALKKENFSIKLKVHFLEERLAQLAPDQIDAALKQNINLKIEVQQRGLEMKKYKKLVLELERELERLQQGSGREKELEQKLEQREREIREMRRRKLLVGPAIDEDALQEVQMRNDELEERQAELEDQLENAKAILEENMEEIERLKELLQRKDDTNDSSNGNLSSSRRRNLELKLDELEQDNEYLRARLEEQAEVIQLREEEKDDLQDEIETLKLDLEDVQRRREAEMVERSASRAQILEEREEREAVEDDLNSMRDKLAAAAIELSQKDDEIELKNREIDEILADQDRSIESYEREWKTEVAEAKMQVEDLKDALTERDAESKELRMVIAELEANTESLHRKFEVALAHMEQETQEKDAEIENANQEIERLGQRVYDMEEEMDRMKEDSDRMRYDDAAERERLEALAAALKEKLAESKREVEELTEGLENCHRDIMAHRARQEELAHHVEELVAECDAERDARERVEADLESARAKHEQALRAERRNLEAKESALQSALNDLAKTQSLLAQRENDLAEVQDALHQIETESRKLGESHTTDRFSLQLEVDRLKRDVERLEDDLSRTRKELEDKEAKVREREATLDRLHAENRELTTQVAYQTQTRLNVTEKLDTTQASLRTAESELASYRSRISDLESKLSKDQRALISADNQYRDQLTERNTLLLTIYQYMEKILGVDRTSKKSETKPFTNFTVFHDDLISRLKALSQIQLDFDKRCKDAEAKYVTKIGDLKKQLDSRWKQIDKIETSLKGVADIKQGWKRKFAMKEGEIDSLRQQHAELVSQLNSAKAPNPGESSQIKSLTIRAQNAEKRLTIAQNQLLDREETLSSLNDATTTSNRKWEARVAEYERLLQLANEKAKRERQGGKERASELEAHNKQLQRQLEKTEKHSRKLGGIVETNVNKPQSPPPFGTP